MDLFLLFVVIFLSVLLGLGLGAALLSLLFKVIMTLSKHREPQRLPAAPATPSQAQRP